MYCQLGKKMIHSLFVLLSDLYYYFTWAIHLFSVVAYHWSIKKCFNIEWGNFSSKDETFKEIFLHRIVFLSWKYIA